MAFTPKLKEAIETLAGFRGPRKLHAVRWDELDSYLEVIGTIKRGLQVAVGDIRTATDRADQAWDQHEVTLATADERIEDVRSALDDDIEALGETTAQLVADATALKQDYDYVLTASLTAEDALLNIWERLSEVQLDAFAATQRLTDAGIVVSEETGEVTIRGIDATNERIGTVEVRTDAVEAEIQLRATVQYVNDVVSDALLDPTQIPALDDLRLRMSEAEIAIDAEEGRVDLIAETLTVEGQYLSLTTVRAELDSLNEALAFKVDDADFDDFEARLNSAETSISTLGDVSAITNTVSATRQLYEDRNDEDERTIAELWDDYLNREALRTAEAQGKQEIVAYINERGEAVSRSLLTLEAKTDEAQAAVNRESIARAGDLRAVAKDIVDLQGDIGSTNASIQRLLALDISPDSALLTALTDLEAAVGDAEGLARDILALDISDGSVLATRLSELAGEIEDAAGLARDILTLDISEDSVLAGRLTTIEGKANNANGKADDILTLNISPNSALLGKLNSLESTINDGDTGLPAVRGGIEDILGLDLDQNSAFGAWLREIETQFGSAKAFTEQAATAYAGIDGLSSTYVLRQRAGKAAGSMEAVAADNPDGDPLSTFKLDYDFIDLRGRVTAQDLTITEFNGNLIPNGDMRFGDARAWIDMPSSFSIGDARYSDNGTVRNNWPSDHYVYCGSRDYDQDIVFENFATIGGQEFSLSFYYESHASSTYELYVAFFDRYDNYITSERLVVSGGSGGARKAQRRITAPDNAARGKPTYRRRGGGSGGLWATNFTCIALDAAETRLTPGSITTPLLAAKAVTADIIDVDKLSAISGDLGTIKVDSGNIRNLAVETIHIASHAITIGASAYSGGSVFNGTAQALSIQLDQPVFCDVLFVCQTAAEASGIVTLKLDGFVKSQIAVSGGVRYYSQGDRNLSAPYSTSAVLAWSGELDLAGRRDFKIETSAEISRRNLRVLMYLK